MNSDEEEEREGARRVNSDGRRRGKYLLCVVEGVRETVLGEPAASPCGRPEIDVAALTLD